MTTNATGTTPRIRTHIGDVLNNKMKKTVIVAVTRTFVHPEYQKVMRKVIHLKAHDERSECQVGDRVRIQESRPISKEKRWRVVEILERSKGITPLTEDTSPASAQ